MTIPTWLKKMVLPDAASIEAEITASNIFFDALSERPILGMNSAERDYLLFGAGFARGRAYERSRSEHT